MKCLSGKVVGSECRIKEKNKLIRNEDIIIKKGVNNYGMKLKEILN